MAKTGPSAGNRPAGLTHERIVDAAIELLDAGGENGLTYRALALRLETGHGAIQWHIANKGELLAAATQTALTSALTDPAPGVPPRTAIHTVALDVFNAINNHPWLASQLFAVPWQPAMVQLWEQLGHPIEELGVSEHRLFTAVSTLISFIIGVGSQNAVNTHVVAAGQGRNEFLDGMAARWESLDPTEHPFVRLVANQLRIHNDQAELLAGIDIILTGLTTSS